MRDRYQSLDRLVRHMREAFERIDRKLAYHRAAQTPASGLQVIKLKVRLKKLEQAFAFEGAKLNKHITNIEHPHIRRPPRRQHAR